MFFRSLQRQGRVFSLLGRYDEAIACLRELGRWRATFHDIGGAGRHLGAPDSCGKPGRCWTNSTKPQNTLDSGVVLRDREHRTG